MFEQLLFFQFRNLWYHEMKKDSSHFKFYLKKIISLFLFLKEIHFFLKTKTTVFSKRKIVKMVGNRQTQNKRIQSERSKKLCHFADSTISKRGSCQKHPKKGLHFSFDFDMLV